MDMTVITIIGVVVVVAIFVAFFVSKSRNKDK